MMVKHDLYYTTKVKKFALREIKWGKKKKLGPHRGLFVYIFIAQGETIVGYER